jgi:hypothetical protein
MPIQDYQAFATLVTGLRLNPAYQTAEARRRRSDAATMARAEQDSTELSDVLLLIGTWERIGILARDLSAPQRRQFFGCTPVGLMWQSLNTAIESLGGYQTFAPNFKNLNDQYGAWLRSADGATFRSVTRQTVCAMFG